MNIDAELKEIREKVLGIYTKEYYGSREWMNDGEYPEKIIEFYEFKIRKLVEKREYNQPKRCTRCNSKLSNIDKFTVCNRCYHKDLFN